MTHVCILAEMNEHASYQTSIIPNQADAVKVLDTLAEINKQRELISIWLTVTA